MNGRKVKRIRKKMIDRGIPSVSALARQIGEDQSYVSRILKGKRKADHIRKKIAQALRLPPQALDVA